MAHHRCSGSQRGRRARDAETQRRGERKNSGRMGPARKVAMQTAMLQLHGAAVRVRRGGTSFPASKSDSRQAYVLRRRDWRLAKKMVARSMRRGILGWGCVPVKNAAPHDAAGVDGSVVPGVPRYCRHPALIVLHVGIHRFRCDVDRGQSQHKEVENLLKFHDENS